MPRPSTVLSTALRGSARATLGAAVSSAAVVALATAVVRVKAAGHLFSPATVAAAPVALALGAQVYPDGTPSSFLAARLDLARLLFQDGTVELILVSGDHGAKEYNEPAAMRRYLIAAGVPADRVVCDYAGFDTYDSCYRARTVFGVQKMIIVSQSYHLPRAVATARLLGIDASGVGDDTVRCAKRAWLKGWARDQVACVKTMMDLLTSRTPMLGDHADAAPSSDVSADTG